MPEPIADTIPCNRIARPHYTWRSFMQRLRYEYLCVHGCPPQGTRWLWEPWVRTVLRQLDPPRRRQEVTHGH